MKIASKMGISTLQSYQWRPDLRGHRHLSQDVIDRYFTNTVTRVGGIGLKEIEEIVDQNHNKAFDPLGLAVDTTLDSHGDHKSRQRSQRRGSPL